MSRWRRKPRVPLGMRDWPVNQVELATAQVVELYDKGYAGTMYQPGEREALYSSLPYPDGDLAASHFGIVNDGKGKLSLPFLYSWAKWPKMWPSPPQTTGSCVSKAGKNVSVILIGVEAAAGTPDPVTGKVEGFPDISERAEQQGVVASEPIYGYRGHSGQGASCDRLIRYMTTVGGVILRQNYEEIGIDLTDAKDGLGARWGGRGTPEALNLIGRNHQIRTATDCPNHEVVRDFCANGYPNWACSGYGWSGKRDANGYSKMTTRWGHSWITMGYDDRPSTIAIYGFPIALYNHDWGRWNSGPRDIRDSAEYVPAHLKAEWIAKGLVNPQTGNILIPEGSMWIDARLLDNCDCTAISNLNGFPRRELPDYGASVLG